MNKNRDFSLYHLLRSIISFCAFIVFGSLFSYILYKTTSIQSEYRELIAFVLSSATAVLLFICFDRIITPPHNGEGKTPARPELMVKHFYTLSGNIPLATIVLHILFAFSLLVAVMYLVSITFDTLMNGSESDTVTGFASGLISYVIFHPIIEEYLFRGLFYREMRPMSSIFACLMQSVMFAISHHGSDDMIFALACGIILSLLAEKSNGIIAPIAVHMLINLRTLLYLTFISDEQVRSFADIGIMAVGFICLILLWLTHSRRYKNFGEVTSEDSING